MTLSIIVRDRATQDLRLQANYILAKGDRKAAENFLESAELTFSQLAKTPKIGKKVSLLALSQQEIRQWRIKNFKNYLIFHQIREKNIKILRILHSARDLTDIMPYLEE